MNTFLGYLWLVLATVCFVAFCISGNLILLGLALLFVDGGLVRLRNR